MKAIYWIFFRLLFLLPVTVHSCAYGDERRFALLESRISALEVLLEITEEAEEETPVVEKTDDEWIELLHLAWTPDFQRDWNTRQDGWSIRKIKTTTKNEHALCGFAEDGNRRKFLTGYKPLWNVYLMQDVNGRRFLRGKVAICWTTETEDAGNYAVYAMAVADAAGNWWTWGDSAEPDICADRIVPLQTNIRDNVGQPRAASYDGRKTWQANDGPIFAQEMLNCLLDEKVTRGPSAD